MPDDLTLRSSVEAIEQNPTGLAPLRDAYSKMQNISDNRGWIYWSGIHGVPQYQCWHHGHVGLGGLLPYDLFLPWHRAYLLYFEHTVRDQNNGASLPWWDWTSAGSHSVGVPKSFASPKVDGAGNPLFSGPMPAVLKRPARQTRRAPASPRDLPAPAEITALMSLGGFVDFSRQLQDIHDQVHPWVGGDMGQIATSAFDPIFWSHHCMIDRVWYLWQLQNGANNIPPDYLDKPLAPFGLTVNDVLDINRLGYEYVQASAAVSTTAH